MSKFFKIVLSILMVAVFISCQKEPSFDTPDQKTSDWPKLKSISTSWSAYGVTVTDSFHIKYDSINNKIIMVQYGGYYPNDSVSHVYSYNQKNQLISYEYIADPNSIFMTYPFNLLILKMLFIRSSSGQLEKTTTYYSHSLIPESTGKTRYENKGDTTFITYVDSLPKHLDPSYYDAADYYRVGLVKDRLASIDWYGIDYYNHNYTREEFEYDGNGNLITNRNIYTGNSPVIFTFQRSNRPARELQKFNARLAGDLYWFSRAKMFNFFYLVGDIYYLLGNCVEKTTGDGSAVTTYTNEFNSSGELIKVKLVDQDANRTYESTEKIEYYP